MPVSVPEPIAAAVVDSLLAAAIAAIFDETGLVVLPAAAVGVLLLIEAPGFVLEPVVAAASELLLPPALLFELVNCPAEVGNTADAPAGAELVDDAGPAAGVAAEAAAVAVEPSRGTDAAAPVDPVLM